MSNADLFWRGGLAALVAYIIWLWWQHRGGR